uniref:Uncharacterized protein n=1 Tax=viral metagenome TaxID=1070528 RepID=A0A6M3K8Y5_9ZZZZ
MITYSGFIILLTPIFWIMLLGRSFTFFGFHILDAFMISIFCVILIAIGEKQKEVL